MSEQTSGTVSSTVKIGMVAPSRAGKTSLLTAVFKSMQSRLLGNDQNISYNARNQKTLMRIQTAIAEYRAHTEAADNVFVLPEVKPTQEHFCYQFATTIGSGFERQTLYFDFLDYPGGMLGLPDFAETIMPHVNESIALLVPIPSELLMEWKMTRGKNNPVAIRKNAIAQTMLFDQDTRTIISDWAIRRADNGQFSILIFVPVKCEVYFNDNGGRQDQSKVLHDAVKEMYIDQLDLPEAARKKLQIETLAVDTFGTVELQDVRLSEDNNRLVSTFRKRLRAGRDFSIKGAFELLSRIIRFKLEDNAAELEISIDKLKETIDNQDIWEIVWQFLRGKPRKRQLLEKNQTQNKINRAMFLITDLEENMGVRHKVHHSVER